jgi:hypothetical protein
MLSNAILGDAQSGEVLFNTDSNHDCSLTAETLCMALNSSRAVFPTKQPSWEPNRCTTLLRPASP